MAATFISATSYANQPWETQVNVTTNSAMNLIAGNHLTVFVRSQFTGVNITDTAGNIFVLKNSYYSYNSLFYTHTYECNNCLGNASNYFIATPPSNDNRLGIWVAQFSGIKANSNFTIVANGSSYATTSVSTSSFNVNNVPVVALAMVMDFGNGAAGSTSFTDPVGYTNRNVDTNVGGSLSSINYSTVQTGITDSVTTATAWLDKSLVVVTFEESVTTVNVLRVGGGGGGSLGGGGGGEVLQNTDEIIFFGKNSITIGIGGTGAAPASGLRGTSGGDTIFNSVTANGGGAGGSDAGSGNQDGLSGGNGGGGGNGSGIGGTGDQFNGGTTTFGAPFNPGSGGGGATQAGLSTPDAFTGGNGGLGYSSSLSGTALRYGGGGGGGCYSAAGTAGTAGDSSAGNGGNSAVNGSNGTTNRGGGGGGAGNGTTGGNGGSGVVIITYKTDGSNGISTSSTGGVITTNGLYTIHTFTSSGTFFAIPSDNRGYLVQPVVVDSVGYTGILTINGVTAGSTILVQYSGTIDLDAATCTGSIAGSYTFINKSRNGYAKSVNQFYVYNHAGGNETITCVGINSSVVIAIYEIGGLDNSSSPLMDSGGAINTDPLTDSLTFANDAFLTTFWYNENIDDYVSLVGVDTIAAHETGGNYNLQAYKELETAGTVSVGLDVGGTIDNVMVNAAWKVLVTTTIKSITGVQSLKGIQSITF